MVLFVLGIGFLHNIMNLLLDVLDALNKFDFPISLSMIMEEILMCGCNGQRYVNGGQWLEPQAHLNMVVANRSMEGYVVAMLNIRNAFIPCVWMFGTIHP
jgi:hypothetical protein